jgi:hypothetical protein
MAIGVGQRCVVRIKITDVELRKARDIKATIVSPQGEEKCQNVSFDEVSGVVYASVDVNSVGSWSMWLGVRFDKELFYTPAFVFAEVEGDAKPCDAPYIVDVEVAGESVSITPPKVDVDAVTRKEFEQLSKDVAGKVDKVEGKGLSTNDFTDEYKQKVDEFTIDTGLSPTSNNAIANSAVVQGLAELAEGVSTDIWQVSERLGKDIVTKANKKGYYPDMSVGMADNLVGRGDVQDAQINFRPSAGEANITDHAARIERIKGNSVVYNQHAIGAYHKNISFSNAEGSSAKRVAVAEFPYKRKANHYYYIHCSYSGDNENIKLYYGDIYESIYDVKNTSYVIYSKSAGTNDVFLGCEIPAGETVQGEVSAQLIDLTQMFGAGNEPTTVEEYYQRKPMNIEDEFAHNDGELIDMKVDSLVSVGDNAWDEEWENGTFNTTTGANIDAVKKQIRSKNLIKVLPNTNYTCTIHTKLGDDSVWCMLLDKNKEVITGYTVPNAGKSGNSFGLKRYAPSFTTPANAAYLKFYCAVIYGNVYTNDICFHLEQSGYKNGKYYPYQQDVKDLSFIGEVFPNGMRSAGSAYDEIRFNPTTKKWEAVKRVESRAFAEGDAEDTTVKTDGATTNYPLATPIVVELDYPTAETNMDYFAWDFGTEEAIVPNNAPSSPFRADINYEPNAVDDLRWCISHIREIKAWIEANKTQTTNIE